LADWQSFVIKVPGEDLLEPVREVMETLLVFLEVLKAILDTIKTFLIDFGNPIRALVEALIRLVEELLAALKATGGFAYYDVPNPLEDPNFDRHFGGFQAFTERFKASLFDSKDFNRPQPRAGSTQSTFIILMVDASSPFALIRLIKQLLRFFGKEFSSPQYAAPENFRAIPVGDSGDPIFAVASIFSDPPTAIQLQWTLPTSQDTPDPGFSDLVTKVATEFIPPNFLIERADDKAPTRPLDLAGASPNTIDVDKMKETDQVGIVEYNRQTDFVVPNQVTQRVTRVEKLYDEQGEPVIRFNKYTVIDVASVTGLLGQLGRFRFIDSDIQKDTTYYYRVRAYSGTLDVNATTNMVNWQQLEPPGSNAENAGRATLRWPSTTVTDEVVMGKPSGIVSAIVPTIPDDFDVLENLRRVFQAGFSLDFHLEVPADATFDNNGFPTVDTSPVEVGKGELENVANILAGIPFIDLAIPSNLVATEFVDDSDPALGEPSSLPDMPWTTFLVRKQSARLADSTAQAFLEAGGTSITRFREIMQGPFPRGFPPDVTDATNMEQYVNLLTAVDDDGNATLLSAQLYTEALLDVPGRLNLAAVIQFIKNFTLGGAPPDWVSMVPLRDIIPWSAQIIYDILDQVQKLLDAFQGVLDEIRQFIDLLIRKINALERFLEFLIRILDFIESLQLGVFILNSGVLGGDTFSWVDVVDNAGGTPPTNNPGGYSGGVALAAVGVDISAFIEAFGIIF